MNTFILMWNPAISSFTMERYEHEVLSPFEFFDDLNWDVWDHELAHEGDRFFLVRCGAVNTGIVMSGTFTSEPYEDADWAGQSRKRLYMDLQPDYAVHPDKVPIVTTERLSNEIPTFDWTGGHSGRILTPEQAARMEKIWSEYLEQNKTIFLPQAVDFKEYYDNAL